MPIWAMLYYKLKVNNQTLAFQEGLVLGALVNFAMIAILLIIVGTACLLNENILQNYIRDWLSELATNKKIWLERLKTQEDYQRLLDSYKNLSIGQYLFKEFAGKMMLLLFVSVVAATALRGEPKAK
ncbi:hypothetical protein HC823_01770, partial [Candidatus Gracilibacteria bacterium]|nr:hypothetical protein [Candidatus Gracilibacteria bacterium]